MAIVSALVCASLALLLGAATALDVGDFQQCGGLKNVPANVTGVDAPWGNCPGGQTCVRSNQFYWQCVQSSLAPKLNNTQSIQVDASQCGGEGGSCPPSKCADAQWMDCPSGMTCLRQSQFFWQCRTNDFAKNLTDFIAVHGHVPGWDILPSPTPAPSPVPTPKAGESPIPTPSKSPLLNSPDVTNDSPIALPAALVNVVKNSTSNATAVSPVVKLPAKMFPPPPKASPSPAVVAVASPSPSPAVEASPAPSPSPAQKSSAATAMLSMGLLAVPALFLAL